MDFSLFTIHFSLFEVIGAVIGLLYVISEYRADRWFWPLSLLMSAFYAVIDFTSGIYANGAICIYNFVMSVYGLLVWRGILGSSSTEASKSPRQISSCPRKYWWQIITAIVLLSALLTWLLGHIRESSYPLLDGVSSAISIVGMLMLAHKWWQQWFCWLLVEPIMIVIFILTGNYASAVLYAVYEVFCILGVIKWKKESIS